MIGGGVTALGNDKNLQTRAYVSLREISHKKGELPMNDANFRYTNFIYTVKYKPSANKAFKKKPFLILSDVLTNTSNSYRVEDHADFLKSAEKNEEVAWLVRNTIHSKALFDLAKANLGIPMLMMFDVVGYAKKVMENEGKNFKEDEKDVFVIQDLKEAEKYRHAEHMASYNKKEVKL